MALDSSSCCLPFQIYYVTLFAHSLSRHASHHFALNVASVCARVCVGGCVCFRRGAQFPTQSLFALSHAYLSSRFLCLHSLLGVRKAVALVCIHRKEQSSTAQITRHPFSSALTVFLQRFRSYPRTYSQRDRLQCPAGIQTRGDTTLCRTRNFRAAEVQPHPHIPWYTRTPFTVCGICRRSCATSSGRRTFSGCATSTSWACATLYSRVRTTHATSTAWGNAMDMSVPVPMTKLRSLLPTDSYPYRVSISY